MYLKLYKAYFFLSLKRITEFRLDFSIGIISMVVEQFVSIAFLFIIFFNFPSINGWVFGELLLMYAIATLGRAIDVTFFDIYWVFSDQYIVTGKFDGILVQPINPLFRLTVERIQVHTFGYYIAGFIALFYSFSLLDISYTFANVLMLIVFVISSGLIYAGINVFVMTLSFWMPKVLPLMVSIFSLSIVGRYPVTIFPIGIAFLTTFVIPYSFTGYYPATFFLEGDHYSNASLLTPVIAILVWIVGVSFFKYGITKYVGAGN